MYDIEGYGEVTFHQLKSGDYYVEWSPENADKTLISRQMLQEFLRKIQFLIERSDFHFGECNAATILYQKTQAEVERITTLREIDRARSAALLDACHRFRAQTNKAEAEVENYKAIVEATEKDVYYYKRKVDNVRALCDEFDAREADPWYWSDITDPIRKIIDEGRGKTP